MELGAVETSGILKTLTDQPGAPGMITQMKNALMERLESYASVVNTFIQGEPARRQHYDRQWQQAVLDTKHLIDEKHSDNQRRQDKMETSVERIEENQKRHEKFVQRGVGVIVAFQAIIVLGGFAMTALTFIGGLIWFLMKHSNVR